MKRSMQRLGVLAAVAAATGTAAAGDWPQWGGTAARNMVSPAKNLPASFSIGRQTGGRLDPDAMRNILWAAPLGTATYGNPTVAGGRVFVGTNDGTWRDPRVAADQGGVIACFEERTGRLLWRLRTPRYRAKVHGSGFDDLNTGVCSSPTIDGNRAYVMTNRAEVLCLDVAGLADGNGGPYRDEGRYLAGDANGAAPVPLQEGDGDILWRFDTISQLPSAPHDVTNCSILVHGDALYVCTGNGVHRMPGEPNPLPDAPSFIVLHKRTGRLLAVDAERIGRRVFHGQWSSPSLGRVGGRTLVFFGGGDGVCYAFETLGKVPDGNEPAVLKKVWSYDCNPPDFKVRDGWPIDYWNGDATRADVPRDYVGPSEIIATPAFHEGRVYVAVGRDPEHGVARGILHCIDATRTGDVTRTGRVWTYRCIARSMSTVAVARGLLFAADGAGVVHCLNTETGRPLWTYRTRQEIWSSPLVADGKVYVGTQRKYLWVFEASKAKKVLAKTRLDRAVSTTPAIAHGVLFVASQRHLFAVRRPAPESPSPPR